MCTTLPLASTRRRSRVYEGFRYTPIQVRYTTIQVRYTPIQGRYTPIQVRYTPIQVRYTPIQVRYTPLYTRGEEGGFFQSRSIVPNKHSLSVGGVCVRVSAMCACVCRRCVRACVGGVCVRVSDVCS
jgi:hypothetical protein